LHSNLKFYLGSFHSQTDRPEEDDYVSCTESETGASNDEEEEQPKTIIKEQPTIEVENAEEKKQRTVNFTYYEGDKPGEEGAAAQEKRKLMNRRR
jgi:hypothetical protein